MVEIKVNKKTFSRSKAAVEPANTSAATPEHLEYYAAAAPKAEVVAALEEETPTEEDEEEETAADEFLSNLTAQAFETSIANEIATEENSKLSKKAQKEAAAAEKRAAKEFAAMEKRRVAAEMKKGGGASSKALSFNPMGDDDLFSAEGTTLLGKERIVLLQKVKQYKTLFPDKLKGFKIKKNPTTTDLKNYLEEMEVLVDVSTVDEFMTESILGSIKVIEGVSSYTKNYDISGLSFMLKHNKQFNTLCKQLYIKYGCFQNVPPEYQLMMIVATSAYICTQKNKQKDAINAFLNESPPATASPAAQS